MISLKGLSTNAKVICRRYIFTFRYSWQPDFCKWSYQGVRNDTKLRFSKLNFYPDPTKQAQEVIFSCKTKNYLILPYCLIMQKLLNLSTTIGSDLTFENHLKMVTTKTEKTIALLRSSIAKWGFWHILF